MYVVLEFFTKMQIEVIEPNNDRKKNYFQPEQTPNSNLFHLNHDKKRNKFSTNVRNSPGPDPC